MGEVDVNLRARVTDLVLTGRPRASLPRASRSAGSASGQGRASGQSRLTNV